MTIGRLFLFLFLNIMISAFLDAAAPETGLPVSPKGGLSLNSKQAILIDLTTGNVLFEKNADENKIWNALQRVGLKERMDRMPEGIHTLLNHDNGEGVDVSGGEAQKIAIARALYKDAPFVILDEPTAALDPMAEAEIYENYNDLVQDKTSIYISHRMSSCRFCDRIVVFQNGRITEEGTHEELLDKNGEYAALFHAQAEYYRESALA